MWFVYNISPAFVQKPLMTVSSVLIFQDEKDQVMHTNVWLTLVRLFSTFLSTLEINRDQLINCRSGTIFKCAGIPWITARSRRYEWRPTRSGCPTSSCSISESACQCGFSKSIHSFIPFSRCFSAPTVTTKCRLCATWSSITPVTCCGCLRQSTRALASSVCFALHIKRIRNRLGVSLEFSPDHTTIFRRS